MVPRGNSQWHDETILDWRSVVRFWVDETFVRLRVYLIDDLIVILLVDLLVDLIVDLEVDLIVNLNIDFLVDLFVDLTWP